MSRWQRPHVSLVMKKVAGMIPLTLVFADEGKKGLFGPAPSSAIVVGGVTGFTIRCSSRHRSDRWLPASAIAPAANSTAASDTRMAHVPPGAVSRDAAIQK